MNQDPQVALKILVAEDSATDRLILQSMLARRGHEVVVVEDGQSAIDAFSSFHPDLVFLDVIMPNVNGIEAAKQIKTLAGEELIPVVFLTSLADAESLATCLDAGGDDFLSKPYNQIILDSKIKAFARMREMHQTLARQKDQIALNNKHLIQEQNVAKQVFDKIAHAGSLDLDIIRYYMSALAVFNGDVLLAEVSPRGSLFVLLGDFTGHGLPAAIGSMPLASTFYGMVSKGFSMSDILREVNQKLNQTLPVGLFCCATCVDINFPKSRLSVWNGGLPDNILYRAGGAGYQRIKSRHLPLGVLSDRDFKANTEVFDIYEGDYLLMWSDGIQEARDRNGNMFGEDSVNTVLDSGLPGAEVFPRILKDVQDHIGASEKDDDVSLVSIVIPDVEKTANIAPKSGMRNGFLEDWQMSFTLGASSLKTFSPLSLLVNVISEVPGLRQNSSVLYTVLSELFNNALEHGVLGLSSDIKSSPTGFADYYRLRKEGLQNLAADAFVKFGFRHELYECSGLLTITVSDSGDGFKFHGKVDHGDSAAYTPEQYFGRGLTLIASICESVEVLAPGNRVQIQFRWHFEE